MQRLYFYTIDRPNNACNWFHHSQLATNIAYLWKQPHYCLDCFFQLTLAGCKSGGGLGGGNNHLPGDLSTSVKYIYKINASSKICLQLYMSQNVQRYDFEIEIVVFRNIVVMYSEFVLAFQIFFFFIRICHFLSLLSRSLSSQMIKSPECISWFLYLTMYCTVYLIYFNYITWQWYMITVENK